MLQLFPSASDAKDSNDDAAYMPSTKMGFKSARILLASTQKRWSICTNELPFYHKWTNVYVLIIQ